MKSKSKVNIETGELMNVIHQLQIKIIKEDDLDNYGFCIVNNNKFIFLNKNLNEEDSKYELCQILSELPLDTIYLKPRIREIFENFKNGK